MTYEVVYVGGPRHGEREARRGEPFDAPKTLEFATFSPPDQHGTVVYERREMADTPGAIAYVVRAA